MSRSVPEWIGRTDDAAIPGSVKDRTSEKTKGRCTICKRPTIGKLRGEADHIIPLILGGAHRESNLQWLCHECHAAKTKLDVKLKAKVARVRKKYVGIRKPSTLRSAGFRKAEPQRSATRKLEKVTP